MKVFSRSGPKRQKEIAKQVFDEELQCLIRLRSLFPDAQVAYYHYWGDYLTDQLHRPNIAHVNVELGDNLADFGIENWETIVEPSSIPGVYDNEGDILMDHNTLSQGKWVTDDIRNGYHPGSKFHELVAGKVMKWLTH